MYKAMKNPVYVKRHNKDYLVRFFLYFILFCSLALSFVVFSPSFAKANPYITVDVKTGRILAHKDAFDRWYPASLTKLMTAYVTFKALREGKISEDSRVVLSARAAKEPPSRSGYKAGSVLDLKTALSITLVKSTNDLAAAIGETIGGSKQSFVKMMNAEAKKLGMSDTHFANANGLPDANNYSTARDIAILAVQIRREFPQYAHYFSIPAIDFGEGHKIEENSNGLINRFEGADGMKTGFICASGYNLVASATRNDRTIITVVLGAERIDAREELAAKLLNNGFKKQGSSKLTLENMRPYGKNRDVATNLRNDICTKEAYDMRQKYRDDEGNIVFNSPFIDILKTDYEVLQVRLLQDNVIADIQNIPLTKIPVPTLRPNFENMP